MPPITLPTFGMTGTEAKDAITGSLEELYERTNADYLFASRIILEDNDGDPIPAYQEIPDETWTILEWPYMPTVRGANTTEWTMNADGGSLDIPVGTAARGIWACSGSAAFEPWISGTTTVLPDHIRKLRWRLISGESDDNPGVKAEASVPFVASMLQSSTGTDLIQCIQVYGHIAMPEDSVATDTQLVCEVWQNSGSTVRTVQYGSGLTYKGTAPLAMCAKLSNYTPDA